MKPCAGDRAAAVNCDLLGAHREPHPASSLSARGRNDAVHAEVFDQLAVVI